MALDLPVDGQIMVGPAGTGPISFTSPPPATEWATRSISGAPSDATNAASLDAMVATNSAALVTLPVLVASNASPAAATTAVWSSYKFIQMRPANNACTLLMAALRNNSGIAMSALVLEYEFSAGGLGSEELPGWQVYYSVNGSTGSWHKVTELSGDSTSGLKTATLDLGAWTNGASLYVLWADDNGTAGDIAYQISDFAVPGVVPARPQVVVPPQNASLEPGASVSLAVEVQGLSPFAFQWSKDGTNIAGATNAVFVIASAQAGDAGAYAVSVTNQFGATLSATGNVILGCLSAPYILQQPAGSILASGSGFSLNAVATGTLPMGWQWYRNGAAVAGATNATFTKAGAGPGDSGSYYAVAVNCAGMAASAAAVISVADPPYAIVGFTSASWRYDDSGTNWGETWKEPGFDDSTWKAGRGVFAVESDTRITPLTNTVLSLSNSAAGRFVTNFYFRSTFVLTNEPEAISIVASNLIDDGAVVYVNGTEVYRINMNAGPVTATTLASRGAVESTPVVTNIPSDAVIVGTNVVAVEVHQVNDLSDDVVMGLQINVLPTAPVVLAAAGTDRRLSIEEAHPLTLAAEVSGQPAYYQWLKDGAPIPGATANPLTVVAVSTSDSGVYAVAVTNAVSAVTGLVATVTVVPDLSAPALIDADGSLASNLVLAAFSERVMPAQATNPASYRLTNTLTGAVLAISRAILTNGTNVLLTTTPRVPTDNYILVVNGVRDVSAQQNVIAPDASLPVSTRIIAVPLTGAAYRYWQPQVPGDPADMGTEWRAPGLDDSIYPWGPGAAPFAFGFTADYEMPFPQSVLLGYSQYITSYYRTRFVNPASPGGARVFLRHFIDAGAIIYLNGVEVYRVNLPLGPVDYLTPALVSVPNAALTDPLCLPVELAPGTNVLAVELHQAAPYGLDAAFTAEIAVQARSIVAGPVVITSVPRTQTVLEGQPVTLSIDQAGGRAFQWRQSGTNITGATNSTYTIPFAPLALDGATFAVRVTNGTSVAVSSNITLHVTPDLQPPELLSAILNTNGTITLAFSERLDPATAAAAANYHVIGTTTGAELTVTTATLFNATNVILSFAALPYASYFVRVTGVRDRSDFGNPIPAGLPGVALGFSGVVQPLAGTWRYDDRDIDLGTLWRGWPNYNDSAWRGTGRGLFGATRGTYPYLPEPVMTTLSLSNATATEQVPTYYFRAAFNAFSAPAGVLTFRTIVDDGCVIYLNGIEIFRRGMPPGPIRFTTFANRSTDLVIEGPFSVPVTNLRDGTNILAVEVHQFSAGSADVYWDGEFSLSIPSRPLPVCNPINYFAPALRTQRSGNLMMISWVNPVTNVCGGHATMMLQETPEWRVQIVPYWDPFAATWRTMPGPNLSEWHDVTTNQAFAVPLTNSMRFYRLRQMP